SKVFGHQDGVSCCVALRRCVLTTIDFDDDPLLEAHKIEDIVLKRGLSAKFEAREPTVAEQPPHSRFSVGRFPTHILGEVADTLGDWSMVWRLRCEALTRRLISCDVTLSHMVRRKVRVVLASNRHT